MRRRTFLAAGLASLAVRAQASEADPYDLLVQSRGGFSGAVLVAKDGTIVFDRAYGFADIAAHKPNRTSTSFELGGFSGNYVAAVVLDLIENRRLNFDHTLGQFVSGLTPDEAGMTIQRALRVPYDSPAAAAHYSVLADVAAAAGGRPFADLADQAIFDTMWMKGTGLLGPDAGGGRLAKPYTVQGTQLVAYAGPAPKTIVFATTRNVLRWLDTAKALPAPGGEAYGWSQGERPGWGRSFWTGCHGFGAASYVLRCDRLTVIVLSNVEPAAVESLGEGLAAQALDGKASPIP